MDVVFEMGFSHPTEKTRTTQISTKRSFIARDWKQQTGGKWQRERESVQVLVGLFISPLDKLAMGDCRVLWREEWSSLISSQASSLLKSYLHMRRKGRRTRKRSGQGKAEWVVISAILAGTGVVFFKTVFTWELSRATLRMFSWIFTEYY